MSTENTATSAIRPVRARARLRTAARIVTMVVCWFAVLTSAILILGVFIPVIPYISTVGTFLVPAVSTWFFALPVAGALSAVVLWRRKNAAKWLALLIVASLAFAGGVVAETRMVVVVESAGVDVDLLATLAIPPRASEDEVVTYSEFDGSPLHLSIYKPAATAAAAPVLMYVHGGGWIAGNRTMHPDDMRWFADQGWLVVSVDYTLSSDSLHLWDTQEGQVACAMTWVGDNAASYGGDSSRLAMIGDSAGGNLVINTSYRANQGTLESSCGGTVPSVRAISTTYPVADPASFYTNTNALLGGIAKTMAGGYTGGSPEQYPDQYTAVTSATYIDESAPPTLITLGERDHLVPTEGAYGFAEQAVAAGVDVSLVTVPYADHAFDLLFNSVGNQAFRQLSQQWFAEHGV